MAGPGRFVLRVFPVLLAAAGCVERRFVVETNVPGAQVYVNNSPVGPSPADARWDYSGTYEFKVVAQGYEPLRKFERVAPRYRDYPPLDFIFENLWPFHIEDVRRFRFELEPAKQVRTDELLGSADALRERARNLPAPLDPDPPKGTKPPSLPRP